MNTDALSPDDVKRMNTDALSPDDVTLIRYIEEKPPVPEQNKTPVSMSPKILDLNKEKYYNFFQRNDNLYDFYGVKWEYGLDANVFWLDTIHDKINPWKTEVGNLEDIIITNTLKEYKNKGIIPYKLINREEALNYSDKVVIYDAIISNSSLLSLSNLIDSASTPGLSSFLSYNKQDGTKITTNYIQKQFYDNNLKDTPVKLLKTKSDNLSCMTQSDINLFLNIFNNNKYETCKEKVLEMMEDADKGKLDTTYTKFLASLRSNGALPYEGLLDTVSSNQIKLVNIFLLNILWQQTCDYMESCGIGNQSEQNYNTQQTNKRQKVENRAKCFTDAIGFLRKFIFTDIVVKGDSYIARFGINLGHANYTMDRNIEFDVTQKACAMALGTKSRNPQSDLCKTTCVGKIFKILEKFENKGNYANKQNRSTRNRFVFMLLKFSGDRSHLVLASMYENPSQVCIFTGERPLTSSVLATHLDNEAPNISCVSLAFKAVRDETELGIGTAYEGIKKNDHFKTISKRTGEEKQLAYMYYNELTNHDLSARIQAIKSGLETVIKKEKIGECCFDSLEKELGDIGDNINELNDFSKKLNENEDIKLCHEIKSKYEKLILNADNNNPPSEPNKFIWEKFERCFVPTDSNIERLNTGETFTELVVESNLNEFRSKLLDCGYKKRNYGISYTEDTINDKVLNYLDYIHSSLDVYNFFNGEHDKKSSLDVDISAKLTNLKQILERERVTFFNRLINARLTLTLVNSKVTLEIKKPGDSTSTGQEYLVGDKLFSAFITQFNDSEDKKTLPKYFNNKEGTPNWKGLLLLTNICEMFRTIRESPAPAALAGEVCKDTVEDLDKKFGIYDIDSFLTLDKKAKLAEIFTENKYDALFLENMHTTTTEGDIVIVDFEAPVEDPPQEDAELGVNVIKDAVYKFFFNLYSFFFKENPGTTSSPTDMSLSGGGRRSDGGGDIRCGQRGGDYHNILYTNLVVISKELYIFLNTNYDNFKETDIHGPVLSNTSEFEKRLFMYDIIEKLLFIIHHYIDEIHGIHVIHNIFVKTKIEQIYNIVIKQLSALSASAADKENITSPASQTSKRVPEPPSQSKRPRDGSPHLSSKNGGGHRTHKIKRRFVKKTNKKGRKTKKAKKIRKRKSTRKNHK